MIFPDDVLLAIKDKMRHDDITILEYLETEGANSPQYSFSKDHIQAQIIELTTARSANALIRLEMACLIDRAAYVKPQKFYITPNGQRMVKLLEGVFNGAL